MLLTAQAYAQGDNDKPSLYNEQLLGVRVLGFFIKDFWDHHSTSSLAHTAYKNLLHKLLACNDALDSGFEGQAVRDAVSEQVCLLGILARNCLMSACKLWVRLPFQKRWLNERRSLLSLQLKKLGERVTRMRLKRVPPSTKSLGASLWALPINASRTRWLSSSFKQAPFLRFAFRKQLIRVYSFTGSCKG